MSAVDFWRTFFEFAAVCALIYGYCKEKKVVEFEKRIAAEIRAYVRARKAAQNKHLNDPDKLSQEFENQFQGPKVTVLDTWRNKKYKEG